MINSLELQENELKYLNIIETIRSSLDINETKQKIIDAIGKVLNADRCFIMEYNKLTDDFNPVDNEYLSSHNILSYKGQNPSVDVPNFSNLLKKGEALIVKNQKLYINDKVEPIAYLPEIEAIKKYKVNSILAIPLYYADKFLGVLSIHYVDNKRQIGKEQMDLLNNIAREISTAMYHSKTYEFVKTQAEKEAILRTIIETVNSTTEFITTKKIILDEIGKVLKAYRCFILTMNSSGDDFSQIDENSVFFSDNSVKSVINYKPAISFFDKRFLKQKEIIALDTKKFVEENNLKNTDVEDYYNTYNVKSSISIPIVHIDKLYGVLIVHYDKKLDNSALDSIDFIRMIAKQIGLAFHQSYLIEKEKKATKREVLLREITKTIRKSLDIMETKQQIVNIFGETMKADRCLILDYDKNNDNIRIIDNEYRSSDKILSLKWRDPNYSVPNFVELLKDGTPIFIKNKTIYKDGKQFEFDIESKIIEKYSINSALVYPLYYSEELLGMFVVHYGYEKNGISQEELLLVEDIADQIAMAIYQAKLYNELEQTTAKQNAILNNIPSMAWLKDEKGKFLAVNEAFAKKCNTSIGNIIGKTDFEFFPKDHALNYQKEDSVVMETKETLCSVDLVSGPDGNKWHETIKSPVFDERGKIIGTVGLASDATEKREAELTLRKNHEIIKNAAQREKLLREIISEISSSLDSNKIRKAIVDKLGSAINSDLTIIYIKDSKTNKFLPVDEYSVYSSSDNIDNQIGKNVIEDNDFAQYINKNQKSEIVYSQIDDLIDAYELKDSRAEKFLDQNKIKSVISCPILQAGEFLGFMVLNFIKKQRTFTDEEISLVSTIAKHAAVALYQSKLYIQAQQASIAKSEFIANMSHELKTPLNIIIGFSSILQNPKIDSDLRVKYLDNINKSGKHLFNLTNDIINISKIESGHFEFNYEKFNTQDLITQVSESMKLQLVEKNIDLELSLSDIEIEADKKMITQVLYNLLINAIKFTPEFGRIIISSKLKNDKLLVSVKDNGIGIDKEHQELIFEKFRQIDSTIARTQEGSGLGLAISKKIIEMHNGKIYVESKKNKGACFSFELPIAK